MKLYGISSQYRATTILWLRVLITGLNGVFDLLL